MHSLQQRTENLDILSPVPVLLRTLRSNQELEKIGSGTESNVYGIGPNLALKIYSGRCYERMSSECLEFEDRAKHELEVGKDLDSKGVSVPQMISVISPKKWRQLTSNRNLKSKKLLDSWGLLMERIDGFPLTEYNPHIDPLYEDAITKWELELQKVKSLGYKDHDCPPGKLPNPANAIYNPFEKKTYLVDFSCYHKIRKNF